MDIDIQHSTFDIKYYFDSTISIIYIDRRKGAIMLKKNIVLIYIQSVGHINHD